MDMWDRVCSPTSKFSELVSHYNIKRKHYGGVIIMYFCKDTGEKVNNYNDYLKTEHWRIFKENFLASKSSKKKCYCCGNKNNLQIHHKTYKRIGFEKNADVIEVCDNCHRMVHEMLKNNPDRSVINLRNAEQNRKTKIKNLQQKKAFIECFRKHSKPHNKDVITS
jgi:hypothetical protein